MASQVSREASKYLQGCKPDTSAYMWWSPPPTIYITSLFMKLNQPSFSGVKDKFSILNVGTFWQCCWFHLAGFHLEPLHSGHTVLLTTRSHVTEWDHPKTARLRSMMCKSFGRRTGWLHKPRQQTHIKNVTLHKTPEVPRVRLRGSFSALARKSQSCSAVRAVSYFDSSRMETWISSFLGGDGGERMEEGLAMLKIDSASGGKAFQNPCIGRVYRRGDIWNTFSVLVFKDI